MVCAFYNLLKLSYFHFHAQCDCFGGTHVLQISQNLLTLTNQWEINNAHDDEKTLKKEKNIFIPESVILVKPAARQNSGIYTLCMIAKVAYSCLLFLYQII